MSIRMATTAEIKQWDESVAAATTSGFMQVRALADVKQSVGWTPRYIFFDDYPLLILEKSLPLLGKIWYAMQAPELSDAKKITTFADELTAFARQHGVFVVKTEPYVTENPEHRRHYEKAGFIRDTDVQPTFSTVWLDVSSDEEAVHASFSSKTRYNIRKARAAGITCSVMPAEAATYQKMYELFTKTADGRFIIRPYSYYQAFWDSYCENGNGFIMFAKRGDELLAADFVMVLGDRASRKDAASSTDKSVRGASALVVDETIRELKQRGITHYDLCNTPHSSQIKNADHPLYGVGKFKTGFSENVTDYIGTYRLEVHHMKSKLWHRWIEKIVRKLYFMRAHQSWY